MAYTPPIRPRNAQATQDSIIEAARVRFMNNAYEQVSLRDIAASAGIDPALVNRYFGSKENLFAEVLRAEVIGHGEGLVGDRATFGRRLAEGALQNGEVHEHYETINTAIWSAASPVAAKIVARDVEDRFVKPIAGVLEGPDAEIRAALIVAIMMGASIMRNMLGVDPLAKAEADRVAPHLAAVFQHLADGD